MVRVDLSALPPIGVVPGAASIRLHRRSLDLVAPVVASHGEHRSRRVLLVEIICADGTVGWGECGAPDDPSYTGETADGAAAFLERVIGPAFVASNTVSASQVAPLIAAVDTDARARHPMAVAAVEMAVLDAQLRAADLAFESTFPVAARRVAVAGATLRSGPIDVVVEDAVNAVADGYSRLKVKIGPGLNATDTIRAIRGAIDDSVMLVGDANGSYSADDVAHIASLGELGLDIAEQPFAAHDTASHQALVATGALRVALDEGVRSATEAIDALANHECTDITLKPARFGYLACVDAVGRAAEHGAGVWIGGMFDTGVARWANVRLASHPSVTLASDVGSSARYWADDVTSPVVADAGLVTTPGPRLAGLSGVPL